MTPQSFQAYQHSQFLVRDVQTPQLLVHPVQEGERLRALQQPAHLLQCQPGKRGRTSANVASA